MIDEANEAKLAMTDCPLITELKKLKKSSSEAVDNEQEFSDFKKYMHIHRVLEDDLVKKIKQAKEKKGKALVLVCGNVGDGKSHIISYLRHRYDTLLDEFVIHNDATESKSRNRNEREELAKVLCNFSDENILNETNDKIIIAINLGVLSNFIDDEKGKGKDFSLLAEYVNKNNILIDNVIGDNSDDNDCFYHINFGDYHIYRLNNGNVDSPYIIDAIHKVFQESDNNPFYISYKKCSFCTVNHCPVKANYEALQNSNIVEGLVEILIEAIVKDKIILSTRELFDFLYDITVHPNFDKEKISKRAISIEQFIEYSLPSLLFEHGDSSMLLSHIKRYDFINNRTEKFDQITTQFNNTDNLSEVFKAYVEENPLLDLLMMFNLDGLGKKYKASLFAVFARLCKLAPKQTDTTELNDEFDNYISDLYYSIRCDKKKLKSLYKTAIKCIYEWNGGSYNNKRINIKNDIDGYLVATKLELEPDLTIFDNETQDTSFEKFPAYINLRIIKKGEAQKSAELSIDYDLYRILKLVENGYRPSAKDNNRYIGFLTFANKLAEFSEYDKELIIQCFLRDEKKEFKLCKGGFGYEFSEVK